MWLFWDLNPGFSPNAIRHETHEFFTLSRNNLRHDGGEYPFYLLTPSLDVPGRAWWEQKLSRLIQAKGLKAVAHSLLCVEYFPYHSTRFAHAKLRVPSQQYSFGLVRSAMARNAAIVVLRSEKLWRAAVPELDTYPRLVSSAQSSECHNHAQQLPRRVRQHPGRTVVRRR